MSAQDAQAPREEKMYQLRKLKSLSSQNYWEDPCLIRCIFDKFIELFNCTHVRLLLVANDLHAGYHNYEICT